ncbi:MAG: DUF4340 domain-containing protein [Phycisphaerales bacterium]|nr:DUF4340 domain-containing protein [Phycisphaerales bacterium]
MNIKTTIVLLVALIVGVVLFFLVPAPKGEDAQPASPRPAAGESKPLFEARPTEGAIRRVEIEIPDRPRMAFERIAAEPNAPAGAQAEYRLVEPSAGATEGWVVRGVISAVLFVDVRERFEPGAGGQPTAAEAGFEPPQAVVRLTDDGGKTYAVEIGRKVVMSDDTYVRIPGEKLIQIAKRDLLPQVRKELGEFRSKRLFEAKPDEVVALRIESEGRTIALDRDAAGDWTFSSPFRAHADREKVRQLATRATQLRVDTFVADTPQSLVMYGLEPPALTFEMTTEKAPPPPPADAGEEAAPKPQPARVTMKALLASPGGIDATKRHVKLADLPWVATISDASASGLIPDLKDLRDHRVVRVRAADVTRVELTGSGGSVTAEKVDGVWTGSGDAGAVDSAAVVELLAEVEALRAIDFIDDVGGDPRSPAAPYGLAEPRSIVTLTATGLVEPITLRVGARTPRGQSAYIQRGDEPSVLVVGEAQAGRLAAGAAGLRSRQVFHFAADQLQALELDRDGLSLRVERAGDGWTATAPQGAVINAAAVSMLASNLARLRARGIATGDAGEPGLERPAVEFRFMVTPPEDESAAGPLAPVEHRLRLAFRDGVGLAQAGDNATVYELDEGVYRLLTSELLDTRLFTFAADDVVAFTVRSPADTLEFRREPDGTWKFVPDPYVSVPAEKVKQVIEKIAQLRVERYERYENADLAAVGLAEGTPAGLSVELKSGEHFVANFTTLAGESCTRFGARPDVRRTFRILQPDCEAIFTTLEALQKADAPKAATPGTR